MLSALDNKDGEDMRHLKFSRGPGSALVFRMKTPPALVGTANPKTGKPFGSEIKLGTGTRHLPEARRRRDVYLGEIRKLEAAAREDDRWSLEAAEGWREAIAAYDDGYTEDPERGNPIVPETVDPRDVLADQVESLPNLPRSKQPDRLKLKRFLGVALRTGFPIDDALTRYLEERKPGNRLGFPALSDATVRDVKTAVRYLKEFIGEGGDALCLQDIDTKQAGRFRYEFLPKVTNPRAPQGLSAKTAAKHITLLAGLWAWARQRDFLPADAVDPWQEPRGIRRAKPARQDGRSMFTPDQVKALFSKFPQGHRLGDAMRLALVTGCRSDELAVLTVDAVDNGATGFRIRAGKTENAPRYVPLTGAAQGLLQRRLGATAKDGRVFPEWPVRPASGKCSALPQAFTRARRKALGVDTDGTHAFHSFRHTWRTVARWAGVPEADVNELGGWAGVRTSNSVYDHGLLEDQLRAAQERVAGMLEAKGFLKAF